MTHPVGEKKPNEMVIIVISGNVWELVMELEDIGGAFDCISRGGSFNDKDIFLNYIKDYNQEPENNIGFRLVLPYRF